MTTPHQKQAVEALLTDYAEAINSAKRDLISGFYTSDGLFMPDGTKQLSQKDLEINREKLLCKNRYSITFSILKISIENNYAFVEASAITMSRELESGTSSTKRSQDFFVLRKEQNDWKIFRYIFNNVLTTN